MGESIRRKKAEKEHGNKNIVTLEWGGCQAMRWVMWKLLMDDMLFEDG